MIPFEVKEVKRPQIKVVAEWPTSFSEYSKEYGYHLEDGMLKPV